ncbi:hypothetical protein [Verrucosispora sp. WMMD573]|nr:hypothetical protein [Verrucosispora sp. WMMD573]WBB54724.1 hypothetical protein O7601_00850 [Verrucosispora sp. WMMD573]
MTTDVSHNDIGTAPEQQGDLNGASDERLDVSPDNFDPASPSGVDR